MARTLIVIILTLLALVACLWQGNRLALDTSEKELMMRAEMSARIWVRHLSNQSNALDNILSSEQISSADEALITREMSADNVFRFKLYNTQGQLVLESGPDESLKLHNDISSTTLGEGSGVMHALASQKPVTQVFFGTDAKTPARYAETYHPIIRDGTLVGVFELYTDVTEEAREIQPLFRNLVLSVGLLIASAMFIPLIFLVVFWMKLEKSNSHLIVSRQKAQDAERTKAEFLANMSHEIRTPMNGVIAMAELLEQSDLDDEQRSLTRTITQSSVALLSIINDILDFSKVEAGKMRVHNEPFDLLSLVQDAAALFSPAAATKSVEIVVECTITPPYFAMGDSARLRQCLLNVVGNAVKFTPEGHIHIWIGHTDIGHVSIKISDTGLGIPEDMLDHIFEEFAQIEDGRTRRFEGTGLGLAITLRLAHLMGGSLTARSRYGHGSVFEFRFPFEQVAPPEKEALLWSESLKALSGRRVLVVEDLEVNRRALRSVLGFFDMKPVFARDGAGAQSLLAALMRQRTPPDLCLIDDSLPDIESEALRAALCRLTGAATMPSVLMIGAGKDVSSESLEALGFLTAIRKPLDAHALASVLCSAVGVTSTVDTAVQPAELAQDMPLAGKTILLAEDNATNRLVIEKLLARSGVTLKMAHNGQQAVEQFENLQPDLVLMDVSMPVMNGYEATEAIRRYEHLNALAPCPIVALTANALPEDRLSCTEAGMSDFLPKPVRRAELLNTLNDWLTREEKAWAV